MPRYNAFLRAANVGGRVVKMAHLKCIFESVGLVDVSTFLTSGNVVFATKSTAVPTLCRKVEAALNTALGYDVLVFIRTDAHWLNLRSTTAAFGASCFRAFVDSAYQPSSMRADSHSGLCPL